MPSATVCWQLWIQLPLRKVPTVHSLRRLPQQHAGFKHRRHLHVASQDVPAHRLPPAEYLFVEAALRERVWPAVAAQWNLCADDVYCKDLFFVQVSALGGMWWLTCG